MEATVVRYCPKCGAHVKAPESLFSTPCRCPTCGERSQFYDYPREPTPTPVKASGRHNVTIFDRLLWVLIAIAISTGIVTVYSLVSFSLTLTLCAAILCLLAGLGCTAYVLLLQRRIDRAEQDRKKFERALMVSNSKISAAAEINEGFKTNLDALVEEARAEALEQIAARDERSRQREAVAEMQVEETKKLRPKMEMVASRLLNETVQRLSREVNSSTLASSREKLKQVVEYCRENGAKITAAEENEFLNQLEIDHRTRLLEAKHNKERLIVEAKLREEQRVNERIEHDIRKAEAEGSMIARSLSEMLTGSTEASDSQITDLKDKLHAVERKINEANAARRSPKAGHVYVLSNVGSFGEGVFLIGTTSLPDPMDQIKEMSGLAVPFPFDVHMLIPSEDADTLAEKICEGLNELRVNRCNHGRRFFKSDIKTIWEQVVAVHGTIDFVEEPYAEEYWESRRMTNEAFQRMTEMHKQAEDERDLSSLKKEGD